MKRFSKHGAEIEKPTVFIPGEGLGMGDCIFTTPVIKKLSEIFDQKVDVLTSFDKLFINNPYIDDLHKVDPVNFDQIRARFETNPNFFEIASFYTQKLKNKTFSVDLLDFFSIHCGFSLLPKEKNLLFFPDPYLQIPDLPKKYIILNPRITGIDRDMGFEKWQRLADILCENQIPVVTVGINNEFHNIKVKFGRQLAGEDCQNNLSQTWHLMDKSFGFVTFDTGMYVFCSTTNTNIFLISTYLEPYFHQSYRQGSKYYKRHTIEGECKEACLSNMKYYVREHAKLIQPLVQKCGLGYPEFKCIPSVDVIAKKIIAEWEKDY